MLCPVDHSELLVDSVDGYRVHRCAQCFGVALGGNLLREVRAYVALTLHQRRDGAAAGIGPCPADAKPMAALEYKGVSLCACPQCLGLWLSGEQWTRLSEIVGPPRQADLSGVVQNLTATATYGSFGSNSLNNLNGLDGIGDILEVSIEIIEAIGKLAD